MKRDSNIDLYKGGLIVLVILGHALQFGFGPQYRSLESFYNDYLFRAIYTFHMPLFMTISGFLFYHSNLKNYQSVILSKVKFIGIPFLSYYIIIYGLIYYYADANSFYFIDFIKKMRINMWFLSSLLLNCMIVSTTVHFFKKKVLFLLVFVLFHILSDEIIPSQHKFMFFYFLVGYMYSEKMGQFPVCNSLFFIFLLTLFFIFTLFVFDKKMFVYGSGVCVIREGCFSMQQILIDLERYVIGIVNGLWFCSVLVLMNKFMRIGKVINYLLHLGNNTLAIYGFQSVAFILISEYLEQYDVCFPFNYITPIVWVVIIILLTELFIIICNKSEIGRAFFLGR